MFSAHCKPTWKENHHHCFSWWNIRKKMLMLLPLRPSDQRCQIFKNPMDESESETIQTQLLTARTAHLSRSIGKRLHGNCQILGFKVHIISIYLSIIWLVEWSWLRVNSWFLSHKFLKRNLCVSYLDIIYRTFQRIHCLRRLQWQVQGAHVVYPLDLQLNQRELRP